MSQIRINHKTYRVKWLTAEPRIFGVILETDGSLSVIPEPDAGSGWPRSTPYAGSTMFGVTRPASVER
jgi:hypothetical protein